MSKAGHFLIPILQLGLTEFKQFAQDHVVGAGPVLPLPLAVSSYKEKGHYWGGCGEESVHLQSRLRPRYQVDALLQVQETGVLAPRWPPGVSANNQSLPLCLFPGLSARVH